MGAWAGIAAGAARVRFGSNLAARSRSCERPESCSPLIDRRHAKVWISMGQPPLTRRRSRPRGNSTPNYDTSSMSAFLIFRGEQSVLGCLSVAGATVETFFKDRPDVE